MLLHFVESSEYDSLLEYGPLAQLVEQLTLNQRVVGSNPTRPTILTSGGGCESPSIPVGSELNKVYADSGLYLSTHQSVSECRAA